MKYLFLVVSLIYCFISCANPTTSKENKIDISEANYALVIHGGAGNVTPEYIPDSLQVQYRMALDSALNIGYTILNEGGESIDAVISTISYMEDCPLFNAGKGAVFTNAETNELDASIMTGVDQQAGSIGGVSHIKNPIKAARMVMEKSEHVMLIGAGAERFSEQMGLEMVDPQYFYTERRFQSLKRIKERESNKEHMGIENKYGTVGCVALDKKGNIVAGTSSGGMTNKKFNRLGDVPIIGAGTYADNLTCGISSTGHGEYFIRYAVAHDISARMEYKSISLQAAAEEVVMKKLVEKGGSGGIVGLDHMGNISMVFNSAGMFRGYQKPGEKYIGMFSDKE